jgi:hypothetical protein
VGGGGRGRCCHAALAACRGRAAVGGAGHLGYRRDGQTSGLRIPCATRVTVFQPRNTLFLASRAPRRAAWGRRSASSSWAYSWIAAGRHENSLGAQTRSGADMPADLGPLSATLESAPRDGVASTVVLRTPKALPKHRCAGLYGMVARSDLSLTRGKCDPRSFRKMTKKGQV